MDKNHDTEKLQNEKTTNKTRITLYTIGEIGGGEGGGVEGKNYIEKCFVLNIYFWTAKVIL